MKGAVLICTVAFLFLIFVVQDLGQRLFVLAIYAAVAYAYYVRNSKVTQRLNTVESFFASVEKELSDDHEVQENKIFYVHKMPRTLRYLKRHRELCETIHELKFLRIYDRACFDKIVAYLEYFLKIHFKIMSGLYDFDLYKSTLKDIRAEVLNTMKTSYFNLPNVSTILAIERIDDFVETRIRRVQGILYKLLKIACRKHEGSAADFKPPYDSDATKDDRYALF